MNEVVVPSRIVARRKQVAVVNFILLLGWVVVLENLCEERRSKNNQRFLYSIIPHFKAHVRSQLKGFFPKPLYDVGGGYILEQGAKGSATEAE